MAKKKARKSIPLLTPDNYIRKKSRNLPVLECWINEDWEDSKMVNALITREHTNGNLTVGVFLVDLTCLGVKDAYYKFNLFEHQYQEMLDELGVSKGDFIRVEYTLVHNIIYAALEFADAYGFKPHKHFSSLMNYFLEEDTEAIELMEIACGKDDKPFYSRGPNDSEADVRRIVAQLERTAGQGNFEFIDDLLDYEDDGWDDNIDVFDDLTLDEKFDLFGSQINELANLPESDAIKFPFLCKSIIDHYVDDDVCALYEEFLENTLDGLNIVEEFTPEMLVDSGLDANELITVNKAFYDIADLIDADDNIKALRQVKKFKKDYPNCPIFDIHNSHLANLKSDKFYDEELAKYYARFPDFPWAKIQNSLRSVLKNEKRIVEFTDSFHYFFNERKELHALEFVSYITFLIVQASAELDFNAISALEIFIEFSDYPDDFIETTIEKILSTKMACLIEKFAEQEGIKIS